MPHVDASRAADALRFHHEIRDAVTANRQDPQWEGRGYRVFPIVGRGQPTLQVGRQVGGAVRMEDRILGRDIRGDGTVPSVSAIPLEFDDGKTAATCTSPRGTEPSRTRMPCSSI